MRVVLLRVGIDTGCGGIHSPLFHDDTFEFLPIPDTRGHDERTYGNSLGRKDRAFVEYFRKAHHERVAEYAMHVDPEFATFTYGDPTTPKRGLAKLRPGDLLVFYAGMEGWDHFRVPALYLVGYFRVTLADFAVNFSKSELAQFQHNYHVRHTHVFAEQKEKLLLIKGGNGSRLFRKAHLLGTTVVRGNGTSWQIITPAMQKVFGLFGGVGSLQRSTPRWVEDNLNATAHAFVESLE